MMTIFRSFLSNAFYGFSGFATVVALTAIPIKGHLYSVLQFVFSRGVDDMQEHCVAAVVCVVKAHDNIKAKYYFSNITRLGYLVDFDLRMGHRVAVARCLFVAGITLRLLATFT